MRYAWSTSIAIVACIMGMCMYAQAQNPTLLKNINPYNGSTPNPPVLTRDVANGVMYFKMEDGSGQTLWRTDGTTTGTYQYADALVVEDLRVIDGLVYFKGRDVLTGDEPWRSDGTSSGTYMLKNIARKSASVFSSLDFVEYNGTVYFTAAWLPSNFYPYFSKSYRYLLQTDGTASGTGVVTALPENNDLCVGNNGIFIHAVDLWFSDGSRTGTGELADVCSIFPAQYSSCASAPYSAWPQPYQTIPSAPLVVDGVYYAVFGDDQHGFELWRSDGTATGTYMVYDLCQGTGSSAPSMLTVMGDYLYCAAYTPATGTELWRFPLLGGPPQLVKDINTGSGHSEPLWITAVDGTLYFSAFHADYGRELWKSDGTAAGTLLVRDINPGSADANPRYAKSSTTDEKYMRQFCVIGGVLYFPADNGDGYELWKSDGTLAGTVLAADINPTMGQGSDVRFLTELNGNLAFFAYEPVNGWEWWIYPTGTNQPPIAVVSASATSGMAPFSVNFSGSASYDPEDGSNISYAWNFGDGIGSSTQMNPSYTYNSSGTYTAVLTVMDQNNETATDNVVITVTSVPSGYVYIADQTLTRVVLPGNKIAAKDVVLIKDDTGFPVDGALVLASYSGPTSGTISGVTGSNGTVTLTTNKTRNPIGSWCFTVTDVQVTGKTYNRTANIVTSQCEGVPKKNAQIPVSCTLHQNIPNPVHTTTVVSFTLNYEMTISLTVFDVLGRVVSRLAEHQLYDAGKHDVQFDAVHLPTGMYLYRLEADGRSIIRKMMLAP